MTISAIRSVSPPGSITTASLVSAHASTVQLHSNGPAGKVSTSSTSSTLPQSAPLHTTCHNLRRSTSHICARSAFHICSDPCARGLPTLYASQRNFLLRVPVEDLARQRPARSL